MTAPLAFICYDPDVNQGDFDRFVQELPKSPVPFNVDDGSLKERFPNQEWDKVIKGQIGRCDVMIVLVSDGNASPDFVEKQIEIARSCNVPFFGILTGTGAGKAVLPALLAENRTIPWDWSRISAAVRQLMAEGKNHKFH